MIFVVCSNAIRFHRRRKQISILGLNGVAQSFNAGLERLFVDSREIGKEWNFGPVGPSQRINRNQIHASDEMRQDARGQTGSSQKLHSFRIQGRIFYFKFLYIESPYIGPHMAHPASIILFIHYNGVVLWNSLEIKPSCKVNL